MENGDLFIKKVGLENHGDFTCTASNSDCFHDDSIVASVVAMVII